MKLWSNIGPLDSTFPLFGCARLRVSARGEFVPAARSARTLSIEVINRTREPVVVVGVYVGYRYTNIFAEMAFGESTPEFLVREFDGAPTPRVIGAGGLITLNVNLDQFEERIEGGQLRLEGHSRYLDSNRIELESWATRPRALIAARNAIARWSQRRLAVAVRDDRGNLHKTKVRWQPPERQLANAHA